MKKILYIFGTRPEAIKLAPLILKSKSDDSIKTYVCVTGQHKEMLFQVLELFNISPDFNLNIMTKNQTISNIVSIIIDKLDPIVSEIKPDIIVVHGDTSSTLSGSLSAYFNKVDLAHVEAGLRTGNIYSPWPEEANRKLTSSLAKYHFAPTNESKSNLIKEGVVGNIYVTGNTVIDSLLTIKKMLSINDQKLSKAFQDIDFEKKIILVTGHRRENFGTGFKNICHAIKKIAQECKDILIVYPVHLNPNVRKPVNELLADLDNIKLLEPLEYLDFVFLMIQSYIILTDSGGIQEEAPSLGKPVLVMRETTERPEAVEAGTVKLVGTDINDIYKNTMKLLKSDIAYNEMSKAHNPYGDGHASARILKLLKNE